VCVCETYPSQRSRCFEYAAQRHRFVVVDGFSHSMPQFYDRSHYEFDIVRRPSGTNPPTTVGLHACGRARRRDRVAADHQSLAGQLWRGDAGHFALVNSESCKTPVSRSVRIAGARGAVIQSRPAALMSSVTRVWVIVPGSPRSTWSSRNRKIKRSKGVELAVDAMDVAEHVDQIVLFSGDGDFRSLVQTVQRRGVYVAVVSTISMVADELRRQADVFIDLIGLQSKLGRDLSYRATTR
jgi:uncharacterized LabA/DUF88 family protein